MAATRMSASRVTAAEVARLRVADSHRRVLMQQQHGHGLAHDVAAAHDDRMLTADGKIAASENLNHSCGRARRKCRPSRLQSARIHGMKSVDIFGRRDSIKKGLCVDLFRQWQLDKDSIDVVAVVERRNQIEHLLRGDGVGRRDQIR